MTAGFRGFPQAAFDFYAGLEADNSKTYWHGHKATYDECVRRPLEALLAELPQRLQPFHVFRPYRDVRFSQDKSPYKTIQGAASESDAGVSHYVHVSGDGVLVAAGMYQLQRDQLDRFRRAVADDRTGPQLEAVVSDVREAGLTVDAGHDPPLATAPRGYPRDHPRIELLQWKGCLAVTEITAASVTRSAKLRARLLELWDRSEPLVEWLGCNVGPSSETHRR